MIEAFSGAYHLDRAYVEPHDGDHAVLAESHHREVVNSIYTTDSGVERLDLPLVVKLQSLHLPVFDSAAVPAGTLAVPDPVLEATGIENPPTLTEILIAKADRAGQLLGWFTPYAAVDRSVA